MANGSDEMMLARLSALLEDAARAELSGEEYWAVRVAMQRAESGTLTPQEQFMDASEFFGLEIVQALQERTEHIVEATKWFARPGPDKQERLEALRRLVNSVLGLDLLAFCYLLHVAEVASWALGKPPHGGATDA